MIFYICVPSDNLSLGQYMQYVIELTTNQYTWHYYTDNQCITLSSTSDILIPYEQTCGSQMLPVSDSRGVFITTTSMKITDGKSPEVFMSAVSSRKISYTSLSNCQMNNREAVLSDTATVLYTCRSTPLDMYGYQSTMNTCYNTNSLSTNEYYDHSCTTVVHITTQANVNCLLDPLTKLYTNVICLASSPTMMPSGSPSSDSNIANLNSSNKSNESSVGVIVGAVAAILILLGSGGFLWYRHNKILALNAAANANVTDTSKTDISFNHDNPMHSMADDTGAEKGNIYIYGGGDL